MANIDFIDKRNIDKLFNQGGYVLDFVNATYDQFVFEKTGMDLRSKYGGSKGKNLAAIVANESDIVVGKLLLELLRYMEAMNLVTDNNRHLFNQCVLVGEKLLGRSVKIEEPKPATSKTADTAFNFHLYLEKLMALANFSGTPQERGYAFERYLYDLFKNSGLEPRQSFKLTGEQIDGSFVLRNAVYLLEAKWTEKEVGKSDLVAFNEKVRSKTNSTRGLFISYSDYSREAIDTFSQGRTSSIILMTVQEIAIMLGRKMLFNDVLWQKQRSLNEEGKFYKHVMEF